MYNFQFYFGRSGFAVGLSAISFSATLQKDVAPIPNALGDRSSEFLTLGVFVTHKALPYVISVSPFQGSQKNSKSLIP